MICRYLPKELQPDWSAVTQNEFYDLLAMARKARKLHQEDIKYGIMESMNLLFSDGG